MPDTLRIKVNGKTRDIAGDGERSLLQVLREDLNLTGTKYGCGEASCGACTVLIDGEPTRSCVTPVGAVGGRAVTTIEGLAQGDKLHPVQEAFLEADALQCGYCTSGMILSVVGLLRKNPDPDEAAIAARLQGNVCRCGTYPRIVKAVQSAARAGRRAQK